ncbi:glycosyltransferase family 4 protein [Vibrio breoganii]|uniref:glycosyltransferase family 4 protein n=1 Tax=Vibrio breoganii TaxID=553239 RepID=UPI0014827852|nr:glycosyltransferase family 4 protein [Vibrio breoganii]
MKIIYIHQYFRIPSMSGGVRSYQQAKRLVEDGHDVTIITSDVKNSFKGWRKERYEGINIHWISVPYNNNYGIIRRLVAFFKFTILSSFHMVTINCDKIIATSTPLTVVIPALVYKFFKNKPFIFEVRDVWPEVPIALGIIKNKYTIQLAYGLESMAYKHCDSIIALSPDMKESIVSRYNSCDVTVIPNASDIELFSEEGKSCSTDLVDKLHKIRSSHRKVIFYTGTFGTVNNLNYLIDLMRFSNGEIACVIVGSGKEEEDLLERAHRNGVLNKCLYFVGRINKDELWIVHKLFDMSVSTVLPIKELYANSANKIFDAFASGTPIMINHGGWLEKIINDELCGIRLGSVPNEVEYKRLLSYLYCDSTMDLACKSSKRLGNTTFNRDVLYSKFLSVIESEND